MLARMLLAVVDADGSAAAPLDDIPLSP